MTPRAALVVAGLALTAIAVGAGCAGISLPTRKGEKAPVIVDVKRGPYARSSLAVGEEKDLARQRSERFGFVRQARVEQYLNEVRAKLLVVSGVTGVPGRVTIAAAPDLEAYSTPDGNVYVSMGCLEELESADEVAAVLAHELAHVLLGHHDADIFADVQHRGRALYELWIDAKTKANGKPKPSKGDAKGLDSAETVTRVTDKLLLPAWSRGQEREADLLGIDLLLEAGYAPTAMISVLEKLRAQERTDQEANQAFLDRLRDGSNRSIKQLGNEVWKEALGRISGGHPKAEERIQETAQYLERHYGQRTLAEPKTGPWKVLRSQAEVREVMAHYRLAFNAHRSLEKGQTQEAYDSARKAVVGRTAGDAYPNVVLARSAEALGRQPEAFGALRRALGSKEPVAMVYTELIAMNERTGNIPAALDWTAKASETFADSPRWQPERIRLLHKAGRPADAQAATIECGVKTPDWKYLCERANKLGAAARATR